MFLRTGGDVLGNGGDVPGDGGDVLGNGGDVLGNMRGCSWEQVGMCLGTGGCVYLGTGGDE